MTIVQIDDQMIDVTAPEAVEVLVGPLRDGKRVVWVNVDGVCRFRACRVDDDKLVVEARAPRE